MRKSKVDDVIVSLLKKEESLSARKLAELGNLNYNTVRGRVQVLVKRGVLEKVRVSKGRVVFKLKS